MKNKILTLGIISIFALSVQNASAWTITETYYDDNGEVWKNIFEEGFSEVYRYDDNGYRIGFDRYNANGSYGGFIENIETKNENGKTATLYSGGYYFENDYDQNGNLTATRSYYGTSASPSNLYRIYEFGYDENGNLISRTEYNSSNVQVEETTYAHDEYGNIIGLYDSNGNLKVSMSWSDGWIEKQKQAQITSVYNENDGSYTMYDKNGNLIGFKGKRIYTIEEADAITKPTGNRVTIRYR